MIRPYKKGDPVQLDEQTRRMLGVKDDADVQVVSGTPADAAHAEQRAQRLRKAQERALLDEACEFGDALISYVAMRSKLPLTHRAWATALSVFNVRAEYPEGSAKFDDLVDQGGSDLRIPATERGAPDKFLEHTAVLEDESLEEAAEFAETFSKYITMKKHQLGLSNPQAAYGLGRAFHNLRLGFPPEAGGTAVFDARAHQAGEYYDRNK